MTTTTTIGVAIPRLGMARQVSLSQGHTGPQLQRSFYTVDPLQLRSTQPDRIPVDWRHGSAVLGAVVDLQLRGGQLWATAELHGPAPDTDTRLFWSVASDSYRDGSDVLITRVAVADEPAMICSSPLAFLPGQLTPRNVERWHDKRLIDTALRNTLDTAADEGRPVQRTDHGHRPGTRPDTVRREPLDRRADAGQISATPRRILGPQRRLDHRRPMTGQATRGEVIRDLIAAQRRTTQTHASFRPPRRRRAHPTRYATS